MKQRGNLKMANKEMEHAIFVELSVFDDFKEFFIAVSALKEALKEDEEGDTDEALPLYLMAIETGLKAVCI